jgi:hypothetical protein
MKGKYYFIVVLLLIGCASKPSPSIPLFQKYSDRIEKTYIGMNLDEFKKYWSEAKFTPSIGFDTDLYIFSEPYNAGDIIYRCILFHFKENKLIYFIEDYQPY